MTIEQLKLEKKRKKMTLQQIADISGVPKRTVDDIFSGHTKNPRIDTMQAIEKALGIQDNNVRNADQDELLELFDEMNEQQKQLFVEMGKTILKSQQK